MYHVSCVKKSSVKYSKVLSEVECVASLFPSFHTSTNRVIMLISRLCVQNSKFNRLLLFVCAYDDGTGRYSGGSNIYG